MRDGGLLGWCTTPLVKLDDHEAPGILARVLTAAPARRQAIFAGLASQEEKVSVYDSGHDLFPASFAEVIRHGRPNDILRRAFGEVPEGFASMLTQIGERPLPRAKDYITLHSLLTNEDSRAAEALRGAGRIADVAVGRMALAEFRGECIVEFRPLSSGAGWLLRDVHIERNRPVPLSLFADVEMKCDEIGMPRINEAGGGDGRSSYRHFTKELEWG